MSVRFCFKGTPFQDEVLSGEFYSVISAVKSCAGRTFDPTNKIWSVAYTLQNIEILKNFFNNEQYIKYKDYVKESGAKLESISCLFPFQKDGVRGMLVGKNLLADDVGLGKSVMALSYAEAKDYKRVLIVCPCALKKQWKEEVEKFFHQDAVLFKGSASKRKNIFDKFLSGLSKYLVVNYEQLRFNPYIQNNSWDLTIFDEVHKLKNNKSLTFKHCSGIKTQDKIGLTATPLVNNPQEFFTILNFLRPGVMNWNFFSENFCEYDSIWNGKKYLNVISGYKNLSKLGLLAQNFMVRRYKRDVLKELPDKTFKTYRITPLPYQKKVISYYENLSKSSFKEGSSSVLGLFSLALMACNSTEAISLSGSDSKISIEKNESCKINELKGIIEGFGMK